MKGKFGLIGKVLNYSFSKTYFTNKFEEQGLTDLSYVNYELDDISEIVDILKDKDLLGLNVTIPYKEQVIPYLDHIEGAAAEINAVNTIKRVDKRWIGYNTDVYGFQKSLNEFISKGEISKALVLGTGGASKAVCYVLNELSISYDTVSRTKGELSYRELTTELIQNSKLIVNTTPLGMSVFEDQRPDLPYDAIDEHHYLYDLVYNPEKSLFLKAGEARNARVINGLQMLHYQAEKSWLIWNKK